MQTHVQQDHCEPTHSHMGTFTPKRAIHSLLFSTTWLSQLAGKTRTSWENTPIKATIHSRSIGTELDLMHFVVEVVVTDHSLAHQTAQQRLTLWNNITITNSCILEIPTDAWEMAKRKKEEKKRMRNQATNKCWMPILLLRTSGGTLITK